MMQRPLLQSISIESVLVARSEDSLVDEEKGKKTNHYDFVSCGLQRQLYFLH